MEIVIMDKIQGVLIKKHDPVLPNQKFKIILEVHFFDGNAKANSLFLQYFTKEQLNPKEVSSVFDNYGTGDHVEAYCTCSTHHLEKVGAHFNYFFINDLKINGDEVIQDGLLIMNGESKAQELLGDITDEGY